jgi:hypothetical protein
MAAEDFRVYYSFVAGDDTDIIPFVLLSGFLIAIEYISLLIASHIQKYCINPETLNTGWICQKIKMDQASTSMEKYEVL